MGGCFRSGFQRQLHNPFHVIVSDLARGSRTRLIPQAIDAPGDEPLAPKPHGKTSRLQLPGDSSVALAAGALQNDPGPKT